VCPSRSMVTLGSLLIVSGSHVVGLIASSARGSVPTILAQPGREINQAIALKTSVTQNGARCLKTGVTNEAGKGTEQARREYAECYARGLLR